MNHQPKKEVFSARARLALSLAQTAAEARQLSIIEPYHLLLGLVQNANSIAGMALGEFGVSADAVSQQIDRLPTGKQTVNAKIELSQGLKDILVIAVDHARGMGLKYITTGHLLMAVIRLNRQPVNAIWQQLHVDPEALFARTKFLTKASVQPQKSPIADRAKTDIWYQFTNKLMELIGIPSQEVVEPQTLIQVPDETQLTDDVEDFTLLIKQQPDNVAFFCQRGSVYFSQKNYEAAIADFNEAIRLKPDFAYAYLNRGSAHLNQNHYDVAIENYNEVIRLAPHETRGYLSRGVAYVLKHEFDLALADFNHVLEREPKNSDAYSRRAKVYFFNNEQAKAIADCNQALMINRNDAVSLHTRGTIYADQGRYHDAEIDFNASISLCPNDSYSHSNLGWLGFLRKDYEKAISYCTEALRLDSENGAAYYTLGSTFAAKGEHERAVANYKLSLNYWINIHTKHSEHYYQEMQAYIAHWDKPNSAEL
jgi:tetratricopeptide (TPR) repeat protein